MDIRNGKNLTVAEIVARVQSEPVNFYPSFKSQLLLTLAALALSALCAFVAWIGWHENNLFSLIIGSFGALFFSACGAAILGKFNGSRPSIILSKQGFTDYHSLNGYTIGWHEIAEVQSYQISNNTFVGLTVFDFEKLTQTLPPWKRWSMQLSANMKLSQFNVPQVMLGGVRANTLVEVIGLLMEKNTAR